MRRLILIRHAKSDWSLALDDHARPLNKRGRRSAPLIGAWLREKGYLPDEVICSDAARTRETFDRLGIEAPVTCTRMLYLAEAEDILEVLRAAEGATVALIGHNPGIGDFAGSIVVTPPAHPRFHDYPTAATLVAEFDIDRWRDADFGIARAVDFIVPRELE
ncbi:histidine phosphatase family protein [Rhodosalinus halophilus]|uniref:Histidine phosphatase family protein n=1 Tax=Rhodosalinus halophilus TaxID=2259333 RepID=A0A365U733_9RHOB|nr:histidine phosphatase family protein [Rhodosalinus halophilus]RBI84362.1 histidine phosphatase family protein [Rhodosalinus halophilus]